MSNNAPTLIHSPQDKAKTDLLRSKAEVESRNQRVASLTQELATLKARVVSFYFHHHHYLYACVCA